MITIRTITGRCVHVCMSHTLVLEINVHTEMVNGSVSYPAGPALARALFDKLMNELLQGAMGPPVLYH